MTKHDKLEKAIGNHKYAIERIKELESEISKIRKVASSRLIDLQKFDPVKYKAPPKRDRWISDSYARMRAENG